MNSQSSFTNIVAFRDFLRARFPDAHPRQTPEAPLLRSTVPCLEALQLGKGAITEVVVPAASSGTGLLISGLIERENTCRELIALVDGSDAFDPWSVEAPALERLLWARCHTPDEAVRASDLLLRDGNIPLVLLDLQMHTPRAVQSLPSSVWHRLRMLAERGGAALCVFTPARAVGCARARVRLDHQFDLMDQFQDRAGLLGSLSVQVERQRPLIAPPAAARAIA